VLVLFPGLIAIAFFDLFGRVARRFPARSWLVPVQSAVLVAMALLTAVTLPRWEVGLRDSIYNIDNCHLRMAEYLNAHYPPGTPMGVFDIGTIGYFSHIDLLDLGGLVDRTYLPYLISGRVPQYLEEKDAHYIILAHMDRTGEPMGPAIRTASAICCTSCKTRTCGSPRSTRSTSTVPPGTQAMDIPNMPTSTRPSPA
jgi:hypothetical protein